MPVNVKDFSTMGSNSSRLAYILDSCPNDLLYTADEVKAMLFSKTGVAIDSNRVSEIEDEYRCKIPGTGRYAYGNRKAIENIKRGFDNAKKNK